MTHLPVNSSYALPDQSKHQLYISFYSSIFNFLSKVVLKEWP